MPMWQSGRLSDFLGIAYPIIQGPFGGGLSSVDLLVAVSEAGGLGSFGMHHHAPDKLVELGRTIRERTDKPFALNLWVSNADAGGDSLMRAQYTESIARFQPYYDALGVVPPAQPVRFGERFERQFEALLEVAPPVFSFVYGIPDAKI
jgi:nitronate monooxygenase